MPRGVIQTKADFVAVFDANCWADVLDDAALTRQFAAWMERAPGTVAFIPLYALLEISRRRGVDRLRRLGDIVRAAPKRVRVAADTLTAVHAEEKSWQPGVVQDASIDLESLADPNFHHLRRVTDFYREVGESFARTGDAAFELDRDLWRSFQEDHGLEFPRDEAIARIEAPTLDPYAFSFLAKLHVVDLTRAPAWVATRPRRFPVAHALAHLFYKSTVANFVPRDEGHPAVGLFRTKSEKRGGPGTRNDHLIAATAALADVLVTNDGDLRKKCEFLREQGLLRFRTARLGDVIIGAA